MCPAPIVCVNTETQHTEHTGAVLSVAPTIPLTFSILAPRHEISSKKEEARDCRASAGHLLNQLMVQQFTREGNYLKHAWKTSPIGLRERHMQKRDVITSYTYKDKIAFLLP